VQCGVRSARSASFNGMARCYKNALLQERAMRAIDRYDRLNGWGEV